MKAKTRRIHPAIREAHREIDALVESGMKLEDATRTVAYRRTQAYFDGLAEKQRTRKRYR